MAMVDNVPSIIFLWSYLLITWVNVILIWKKKPQILTKKWKFLFGAFFFLGLGDIFHLFPRTYLWYLYTFENQIDAFDTQMGILINGTGLILTGITITLFYLLFYLFWKEQFINDVDLPGLQDIKKKIKNFDIVAYGSMLFRVILILLPWNQYGGTPVYYLGFLSFRLITNLPLYILGFEVVFLFVKSISKTKDSDEIHIDINKALKHSSIWITVSFISYTISLLGTPLVSLLGMMMIPKTIAYLAVLLYMKKYILVNPSLTQIL